MTEIIVPSRRGFVAGLAALIAAPAIVRAGNIMPVRNYIVLGSVETWFIDPIELQAHCDYVIGWKAGFITFSNSGTVIHAAVPHS